MTEKEFTSTTSSSSTIDRLESALKESFKLSSYEAKAYVSLLKIGKQTPKQVSSNSGIPLPRVYDTIESLMSKGFAIKRDDAFSPISPKQALKGRSAQFEAQFLLEQKQRKVAEQELASQLQESFPNESAEKDGSEISILKGFNSIANKFSELLEGSTDIILVAKRAIEAKEVFIPILLELGKEDSSKQKTIRIIAPKNAKISKQEIREARKANVDIRKSSHVLFDMMITDRDDVIIGVPDPLSEEINHAIAIWVRNSSFARSTRNAVEEIWKSADRIQS